MISLWASGTDNNRFVSANGITRKKNKIQKRYDKVILLHDNTYKNRENLFRNAQVVWMFYHTPCIRRKALCITIFFDECRRRNRLQTWTASKKRDIFTRCNWYCFEIIPLERPSRMFYHIPRICRKGLLSTTVFFDWYSTVWLLSKKSAPNVDHLKRRDFFTRWNLYCFEIMALCTPKKIPN